MAIQAAFPTYDDSLWRDVYIGQGCCEVDSTDSWSLTAGAYCTLVNFHYEAAGVVHLLFHSD